MNVVPEMGRLIHQQKRHEAFCVSAPPTRGPAPPAMAHINSVSPIYRLLALYPVSFELSGYGLELERTYRTLNISDMQI